MALINTEKKFIFFHLFKCAGNSMRYVLNNPQTCYEYKQAHCLPSDVKHLLYSESKQDIFDNYFKFTIIRNPYDWMVSTYYYILISPSHRDYEIVKNINLTEFIRYYGETMMLNNGKGIGHNKCVTLFDYVYDNNGNKLVDFIGRFESIRTDMKTIFDKIGMEHQDLPMINITTSKKFEYKKYYNEESKKLIQHYFSKDLEEFKYKF